MIRVKIGDSERDISDADANWINQQVNGLRRDGRPICIRVTVKSEGVDMMLSTPACGSAGGGGRPPNRFERDLFDRWDKLHLNSNDFTGGNLVAFLKQLAN